MRPTVTSFRIGLAFSALTVSAFGFGQRVTLKLNLPTGKSMKYTMTSKVVSDKPKEGGGINVDVTQQMKTTMSVLSKTAKGTKVRTKIDDAKVTAPKGSMMSGRAAGTAAELKGATFEAVYDSRGRNVPGSMAGTGGLSRNMQQMGGLNFGFLGAEYPAGAVSPGSTWSTSVDLGKIMSSGAPGMMRPGSNEKIPVKYKLVKVAIQGGRSVAHLTYDMKGNVSMNMGGGGPGNAANGQSMAMKIALNMKGKLIVDVATGAPISGSSSGTTNIAVGTMMNLGQKISVTFRQL